MKAYEAALEIGEAIDILEAIYDALENAPSREGMSPQEMAWYLANHLGDLNLQEMVENIAANQIEDKIIGGINARAGEAMKKLTGQNRSVWFT